MFKYLLSALFFIMLSLESCQKKTVIPYGNHAAVLKYLGNKKNYQDKNKYVSFFEKNYNNYIDKKEYRNAEETLIRYGDVVNRLGGTDSIIYKSIFQFIKREYPVKKDTVHAALYYYAGLQLLFYDKMDSANIYAKKAMDFSQAYPSSKIYLDSKALVAKNYSYMGEYKKAIPIFLEIIKTLEKENKQRFLGIIYNDLAYCYDSFYAYKEAEKYYLRSGQKLLQAKDTSNYLAVRTGYIMNNINGEKDTLKTLNLISATDKVYRKYKNPSELTAATVNDLYALKYKLKKNYDSAAFFNKKGYDFFMKINNYPIAETYKTTGEEIFFLKNGYLRDPKRAQEMAAVAKKEGNQEVASAMYGMLYKDALNSKKYEDAVKYLDLEVKANEILQKENAGGKLFEFEKKYQNEKNQKEISTQKAKILQNDFYIIGLLLILAILILLVILYLNKQKRQRITQEKAKNDQYIINLLENIEVERNRIAYELHDSVNHSLLSLKNTILSKKEVKSESVSNIIDEVREISRNLYPVVLEKVGLKESIKSLAENFSNETDLFVTVEIEDEIKIKKNQELHVYRIIQEALNNTLKHAKATVTKINISVYGGFLQLSIKDNGEGFDVLSQLHGKNSFGLQGITQRAQAMNAKTEIKSDSGGTEINIKIPIE